MSLLNVIKQAGVHAVEAGNPVAVMFGLVTRADPLEVKIDQRFTLTAHFLVLPERLTRYEIDLQHHHAYSTGLTEPALPEKIVIRAGLQAGDGVALIRMQGGQKFMILDKVVSG